MAFLLIGYYDFHEVTGVRQDPGGGGGGGYSHI